MNLNLNAQDQNTYDAIVVGTGISGGWAAKELTEKGLKTLVLERGRDVRHIVDYPTMTKEPWQLPHANKLPAEEIKFYPVQSRTNWVTQANKHWWVKDDEHPYTEVKPFDWIVDITPADVRSCGESKRIGYPTLTLKQMLKDGVGVDWPIRYKDLAPWYDHVETFIGVSGRAEGLSQLPDGKFLPPMDLNCVEEFFREKMAEKFESRHHYRPRCTPYSRITTRSQPRHMPVQKSL